MRFLLLLACALNMAACTPLADRSAAVPEAGRTPFEPSLVFRDEAGRDARFSSFRGEPVVLTAIFTSCQVRCPLTIQKLRRMDEAFRRKGRTVAFALVTLDPATDSPERLLRFKRSNHLPDNWHFLAGSEEDTRQLGRALAVNAIREEGHIDHEVKIAVLDAEGRLLRSFQGWDFDEEAALRPLP